LNKSPLFNILNNCSGDILFTDKAKKNAEAIFEEIEQQSQYYQAYQFYFKEQPLSLKQIDLLYPELLKNIPTDSID
jgi:LPS sulfotransferase NodH